MSADERDERFRSVARTSADSAAEQILKAAQKRRKRLLIADMD